MSRLPRALGSAPEAHDDTQTNWRFSGTSSATAARCRGTPSSTRRAKRISRGTSQTLASAVFSDAIALADRPRDARRAVRPAGSRCTSPRPGSTRHGVTRSAVAEWLDALGAWGLRSHEKRVPEAVFEQPAESGRALPAAPLGDGWLHPPRRRCKSPRAAVYYASSSGRLARDVQSLLLRVGIVARVARISAGREGARPVPRHRERPRRTCCALPMPSAPSGHTRAQSLAEVRAFAEARVENTNRDVIPRAVWRSLVVAGDGARRADDAADAGGHGDDVLRDRHSTRPTSAATRASAVAAIVGSEALVRPCRERPLLGRRGVRSSPTASRRHST